MPQSKCFNLVFIKNCSVDGHLMTTFVCGWQFYNIHKHLLFLLNLNITGVPVPVS